MTNAVGPDAVGWHAATDADLNPHNTEGTMAFMVNIGMVNSGMVNIGMVNIGMVKSCRPFRTTAHALKTAQPDCNAAWADFPKAKIK